MKVRYIKKTLLLTLVAVGTFSMLFSSCSTTEKTATAPSAADNTIADDEHYNPAAMGYDNNWPYGPNTYK
jgi:hypothetical protein